VTEPEALRSSALDRIRFWNRELLDELLPVQEKRDVPVLLACDDETLRAVAERLGLDALDAADTFAQDVKVAFNVGLLNGFKYAVRESFDSAPRPRPIPQFFALLCLWVLAASRMGADEKYPTLEYYGRLNGLLDVCGDDKLPFFEFIETLFAQFAEWLAEDLNGERGRLVLPEDSPHHRWVGLAVSQTVFRARDREVLSQFFTERLRTLDGFDPLRRLRRWSGRHRLTNHALRMLEDERAEERVRAGIRSAFNAWDGSELVATPSGFGRLWPATIHLFPYPEPRLQLGAGNAKPLELNLDGTEALLDPGTEVELPWALIDRLRGRSVQLGDPRSPAGGLRLPQLGDTVLFELGDVGLLRVERPAAQTVWVLTREERRQEKLAHRRLNDRGALPSSWQLFREVSLEELPEVERAPAPQEQEPLRLTGGLPLGRAVYLSGFAPALEAGELDLADDEWLPVVVNEEQVGVIGSGELLPLRATQPGTYRVRVGDGEFMASYDVEAAGEPVGVGSLVNRIDGRTPLQSGARPLSLDQRGLTVCGAALSSPYEGTLPILSRSSVQLATIDRRGELETHDRPPTPAWFTEVGLDEAGRWEIFRSDVVWVISPRPQSGRRWVRRVDESAVASLTPAAAELVLAVGAEPVLSTAVGDCTQAREQWAALVDLAGALNERP
jgi:hypothetical protein